MHEVFAHMTSDGYSLNIFYSVLFDPHCKKGPILHFHILISFRHTNDLLRFIESYERF